MANLTRVDRHLECAPAPRVVEAMLTRHAALNPDRASRQRDIAIGAAVFEGPAVTLASNAGAPAAAPLASNQPQAAACAPESCLLSNACASAMPWLPMNTRS